MAEEVKDKIKQKKPEEALEASRDLAAGKITMRIAKKKNT